MTPAELAALLTDALRLPELERICCKGGLYDLTQRSCARREVEGIEARIRAALEQTQTQIK